MRRTWRPLFIAMMLLPLALSAHVAAQSSQHARAKDLSPLLLGDLYSQVQRINPRVAAARSLTRAAEARVPGASRPPDPQLQLGFMKYELPRADADVRARHDATPAHSDASAKMKESATS